MSDYINGVLEVKVKNANGNRYTPDTPTWYDSINGFFRKEDPVNGTDEDDGMGDVHIQFRVPEGHVATIDASLTVDDWGQLDIVSADAPNRLLLHLGMRKGIDAEAGPRGGHIEWSKEESVDLLPGDYIISIFQENAKYDDKYADKAIYNISKCEFTIVARKVAATCEIIWPRSPIKLFESRHWYEQNTPKSTNIRGKWNEGVISSISPEEFRKMAQVIYAEASPADPTAAQRYNMNELKAIAAVMINRLGKSNSYEYQADSTVTNMLTHLSDQNGWTSVGRTEYNNVEGDKVYNLGTYACQKLKDVIEALTYVICNGPIINGSAVPFTRSISRKAATLPLSEYTDYGTGNLFRDDHGYFSCYDSPPIGWDELPVDPNGPLASQG